MKLRYLQKLRNGIHAQQTIQSIPSIFDIFLFLSPHWPLIKWHTFSVNHSMPLTTAEHNLTENRNIQWKSLLRIEIGRMLKV